MQPVCLSYVETITQRNAYYQCKQTQTGGGIWMCFCLKAYRHNTQQKGPAESSEGTMLLFAISVHYRFPTMNRNYLYTQTKTV